MSNKVLIKLIRSGIGQPKIQRETLKGLGLKKIGQTRILENTLAIQGMIKKVIHLIEICPTTD